MGIFKKLKKRLKDAKSNPSRFGGGSAAMFAWGMKLLDAGDTQRAREVFNFLIAFSAGHKLLPDALYGRAESFFAEGDYKNAILAFSEVMNRCPGSGKVPGAMYREALSFLALGDQETALTIFALLQEKYSESPAAEQALQKALELTGAKVLPFVRKERAVGKQD